MIKTTDTTRDDLLLLIANMRDDDRREIEAYGLPINKVVWRSYKGSLICKSIFVNNELAAIFGLAGELLDEVGTPWLFTTYASEKVSPLRFARIYQREVLKMLRLFPALENYVDTRYTKSIRLLENIGFTVHEPNKYGMIGSDFRRFEMKRKEA